jgi:hypothetical protein
MPGVTYPWAENDSNVGQLQASQLNVHQVLQQKLLSMVAGDNDLIETKRQNFSILNQQANIVGIQALNGSNPTLAETTLALNAVARQPWNAPVNPVGGPGANPTGGGTVIQMPAGGAVHTTPAGTTA